MPEHFSDSNRKERLEEAGIDVAKMGDPDYRMPSVGGCWICRRGNGYEDDDMAFDIEFDTFYHPEHLEELGVSSILEYERDF